VFSKPKKKSTKVLSNKQTNKQSNKQQTQKMSDEKILAVQELLKAAVVEQKGDDMKNFDNEKLDSDLLLRFQYLSEFMGFGEADLKAINDAAPVLARVSSLCFVFSDATIDKSNSKTFPFSWSLTSPQQFIASSSLLETPRSISFNATKASKASCRPT
jgi:hypothetical protein